MAPARDLDLLGQCGKIYKKVAVFGGALGFHLLDTLPKYFEFIEICSFRRSRRTTTGNTATMTRMGGFEQRPWTPTKRRGMIAAEHTTPGPAYQLPQLLGKIAVIQFIAIN